MLSEINFNGWSLLVIICIIAPLCYHLIIATDEPAAQDPIEPVANSMALEALAPVDEAEHS